MLSIAGGGEPRGDMTRLKMRMYVNGIVLALSMAAANSKIYVSSKDGFTTCTGSHNDKDRKADEDETEI